MHPKSGPMGYHKASECRSFRRSRCSHDLVVVSAFECGRGISALILSKQSLLAGCCNREEGLELFWGDYVLQNQGTALLITCLSYRNYNAMDASLATLSACKFPPGRPPDIEQGLPVTTFTKLSRPLVLENTPGLQNNRSEASVFRKRIGLRVGCRRVPRGIQVER